jgi:hypothetical protein
MRGFSTKARLGIWVNDTLLRRGSMTEDGPEALQFGKLYTEPAFPGCDPRLNTWSPECDLQGICGDSRVHGIGISTKARLGIWVNDTLLRRGSMTEDGPEALQFGKLLRSSPQYLESRM